MKLEKARIRKVDYYDEYGEFSHSLYFVDYEAKFLWIFRYWKTVKERISYFDYVGYIEKIFTSAKAAENYITDERRKVGSKIKTEIIIVK